MEKLQTCEPSCTVVLQLSPLSFSGIFLFAFIHRYFPIRLLHIKRDTITGTPAAAAQLYLLVRGLVSWLQFQLAGSTMICCQHCASEGGIK